MLNLTGNNATASIDPMGGRLASLIIGGSEVLVTEGPKPTRWGSFPMIPWCGRLREGRLDFAGSAYTFPLTSPPHANHGFSHLQEWNVLDEQTLATDLGTYPPFNGYARQRFGFDGDALTIEVEVCPADGEFPVMAGWHPWFRRMLDRGSSVELDVDVERAAIYQRGADGIPTGALTEVPSPPWDECFVGLGADPVLRWPGALELTLSSSFDHWVLYTEPDHAVCVEPQSGAPNDLNVEPWIATPHRPVRGWMKLSWQTLDP